MATSGVTTGTMTVGQLLTRAGRLCGLVHEGKPALEAWEAQAAKEDLNWLLKSFGLDGCHIFRAEEIEITWPADTSSVQLDVNYLDLSEVRVRTSGLDRPLTRLEAGEYVLLADKEQSGTPVIYTLGQTVETLTVKLWPVPTDDVTIVATGSRVLADVTSLTETLDLPQAWLDGVTYTLADRMFDSIAMAAAGSPQHERIAERAQSLLALARDADRPASYFLLPGR